MSKQILVSNRMYLQILLTKDIKFHQINRVLKILNPTLQSAALDHKL